MLKSILFEFNTSNGPPNILKITRFSVIVEHDKAPRMTKFL